MDQPIGDRVRRPPHPTPYAPPTTHELLADIAFELRRIANTAEARNRPWWRIRRR